MLLSKIRQNFGVSIIFYYFSLLYPLLFFDLFYFLTSSSLSLPLTLFLSRSILSCFLALSSLSTHVPFLLFSFSSFSPLLRAPSCFLRLTSLLSLLYFYTCASLYSPLFFQLYSVSTLRLLSLYPFLFSFLFSFLFYFLFYFF